MQVYGIYHGGHSYSTRVTNQDIEEFNSLKHARDIFESRNNFDPYYPCTDETASMWLFFTDPSNHELPDDALIDSGYPDRVLEVGPRGGVVSSNC